MQYIKSLAQFAVAVGLMMAGASQLSAADWRDIRHDYARVDHMRADIARDRARLDEHIRCGRQSAAARDARDLARDQRALDAQLRDIRRDTRRDYRDPRW
jgi:hypothetical protein